MNEAVYLHEKTNIKGSSLFLFWLGIQVLTWLVTIAFASIPNQIASSDFLSYIFIFFIGAVMGISQWFLLRRPFSIAWYEWILLTTIGFAVGFYGLIWAALRDHYIIFSPPGTPVLEWDPLLGGALLGLALGCCQSIVWRPRIDRSLVWITINIIGWSLGMFLPQYIAFVLQNTSQPWLSTLFPVIFAAVATGIALVWFSREAT